MNDLWERVAAPERGVVGTYSTEAPVKVGELARALGLDVNRAVLEPRVSGLIRPSDVARSGFEIRVNKFEPKERQRFTVAHEIAHYLLHRNDIGRTGVVDNVLYRSSLTSRKEAEANRLAADIVMPSLLVREAIEELGGIINESTKDLLAQRFGVSTQAMKIKLGL